MTDVSMLVTNKTLSRMGAKVNESKGSKISDFALKQMEKMGWKEGEGLPQRLQGTHQELQRLCANVSARRK